MAVLIPPGCDQPSDLGVQTCRYVRVWSGLLAWLGTLPLAEVRIEPLGLRTVYEKYHAAQETTTDAAN